MEGVRYIAISSFYASFLIYARLFASFSGKRQMKIKPLSEVVIRCFILFEKHIAVVIWPGWARQSGCPVAAS